MKRINVHLKSSIIFGSFLSVFISLMIISIFPTHSGSSQLDTALEDMVLVKGGCFPMGDIFRDVPSSEKPVHEVCLDDFYIGKYEVTVGEFRTYVDETGYRTEAEKQDGCHSWVGDGTEKKIKEHYWGNTGFPQTDRDPVVCVSWNDANEFIKWLNEKSGTNFRLPTEAEWEYAARSGGKKYKYSWGNSGLSENIADDTAERELLGKTDGQGYNDGYAITAPAGSFRPNELGLYDMSGNVSEWVADWFDEKYYSKSPKKNPRGPDSGKCKVIRGGTWNPLVPLLRTTTRLCSIPGGRGTWMGFRLAHPVK